MWWSLEFEGVALEVNELLGESVGVLLAEVFWLLRGLATLRTVVPVGLLLGLLVDFVGFLLGVVALEVGEDKTCCCWTGGGIMLIK